METYVVVLQTVFVAIGLGALCGINLYAVVLFLGVAGRFSFIELPSTLNLLEHGGVIAAAFVMFSAEFWADKRAGFEAFWDSLQAIIRIPAGALLAVNLLGPHDPLIGAMVSIAGGVVAAISYASKACIRVLVNQHLPVLRWPVSLIEDILVFAGAWAAYTYPDEFIYSMAMLLIGMIIFLIRYRPLLKFLVVQIKQLLGALRRPTPAIGPAKAPLITPNEASNRLLSHTELLSALERLYQLKQSGAIDEGEYKEHKQLLIKSGR